MTRPRRPLRTRRAGPRSPGSPAPRPPAERAPAPGVGDPPARRAGAHPTPPPAARELRLDAQGLIPAIVQESKTGEVLMVAWMNADALRQTLETRRTHFWSRSRQTPWEKGEASGHRQHVEAVYADCDRDTLLLLVHQEGVACHTGSRTCFFTRLDAPGGEPGSWEAAEGILETVQRVIQSRRAEPREGSYVTRLLAEGQSKILRKVGEESAEVIVAATAETPDRLVAEIADLWFHTLVLLGARDLSVQQVLGELARRHRPGG